MLDVRPQYIMLETGSLAAAITVSNCIVIYPVGKPHIDQLTPYIKHAAKTGQFVPEITWQEIAPGILLCGAYSIHSLSMGCYDIRKLEPQSSSWVFVARCFDLPRAKEKAKGEIMRDAAPIN